MAGGVRAAGFAGGLRTLRAHRAKGAQLLHLAVAAQPAVRSQSEGGLSPKAASDRDLSGWGGHPVCEPQGPEETLQRPLEAGTL